MPTRTRTTILLACSAALALSFISSIANAATPTVPDSGPVLYIGQIDDAGLPTVLHVKPAGCTKLVGHCLDGFEAVLLRGSSVRSALPVKDGSPHFGEVLGKLKAGTKVKLGRLHVLNASDGEPHAVWARLRAPSINGETGRSGYGPTSGDRLARTPKRHASGFYCHRLSATRRHL